VAIHYARSMKLQSVGEEFRYTDRDAMLYALGVGFGTRSDEHTGVALRI